ncbi:Magnesium transporter [Candidatus Nitrotoga sp. BS]|uniref:magnesium transporter n=1 Tax=Candidatus Nitrotoga sp. BS TaxID=2890408 RepID=UPI001EF3379F|nr:magnesium transporter [Candidatus Nitrotoga sp. BS]CAH1198187.1 Magnesium transporter [Candidatus Nitrotoga sp. BS]
MAADTLFMEPADAALTHRFLLDYPQEAARLFEAMPTDEAAVLLAGQPPHAALRAWQALAPDVAVQVLEQLPVPLAEHLLAEAEPVVSIAALTQLDAAQREAWLKRLHAEVAHELRGLLAYPEDCAGRMMDPRVSPLRSGMTVAEAVERLRQLRRSGLRELFVVDDDGRLTGRVEVQDLALANRDLPLSDITRAIVAQVGDLDPREEVVETLQEQPITVLPVVNISGRFIGVIRQAELMAAVVEETSLDIQTMVGASPDERALSSPMFAVKKRLPWLQINLLTAFLASAVVGLFETTIAQITALAVLLPVVAGQSGNAGAQALAVTMRGLALREISLRHWPAVVGKEALVGVMNGIAVAATTGLVVFVWSRSLALVGVIMLAMVISMFAAGLAGALVPILLRRIGQDPATASSIILTTVTDIVGFFSFLGIAALFAPLLMDIGG